MNLNNENTGFGGNLPTEQVGSVGQLVQPTQNLQSGGIAWSHALRRNWPVAIGAGIILAAIFGAASWSVQKPRYVANALLKVSHEQEQLVFETNDSASSRNFEVFKSTQQQLVKSDFVLIQALREPSIARLSVVQKSSDPVDWLSKTLRVSYPGQAELMQVSLSLPDQNPAQKLVDAVVQSYLVEVVNKNWSSRQERLENLDRIKDEKKQEVVNKRAALKSLIESVGTSDSNALAMRQQIAVQEFGQYRSELTRIVFELRSARSQLAKKERQIKSLESHGASNAQLQEIISQDQTYTELLERRKLLMSSINKTNGSLRQPFQAELNAVDKEIEKRLPAFRDRYVQKKTVRLTEEINSLRDEISFRTEEKKQLENEVADQKKRLGEFGGSSVDVELMNGEIARLENVLNMIAEERERLRVEIDSKPRIELIQPATVRRIFDRNRAIMMTLFSSLVGFGLPIAGMVWWDLRCQRVNSHYEVERRVGIPVIGTLPIFPRLGQLQSKKLQLRWEAIHRESIRHIVASVLMQLPGSQTRTIVISSASSGEGKTTLATQLSTALAQIGKRTLLVDFDLRRPTMHQLFDKPLSPGVSEILYGEADIESGISKTSDANLYVMPAGRWKQSSFSLLTNGSTEMFMREIRNQFDVVVVDSSPMLSVVDSRMILSHSDLLIVSVLRDKSRLPSVQEARDIAVEYGATRINAVVTSSGSDIYDAYYTDELPMDISELPHEAEI